MPRAPAHPRVTGGGGFQFEDQVVASFLAFMLANRPILGVGTGSVQRIAFQTGTFGWFLDDVLLELRGGSVGSAALSIKSNHPVTSGGVPASFVEDGWAQLLGEGSDSFEEGRDLVVLVTAPLAREVHGALHELVRWSIHQRDEDLEALVRQPGVGNDVKRSLLQSLRCPVWLAGQYSVGEQDTARLVRHSRFLEFDFLDEPSRDEEAAVEVCRQCLVGGELAEAVALWEALCRIAAHYRPEAGSLDLPQLVKELGGRFLLRDFPDYRSSWEKLRIWSRETWATVPDTIGGQVRIARTDVIRRLKEELEKNSIVVLLAPSGAGKSVLARQVAEGLSPGEDCLWVEAASAALSPTEIASRHELRYPLADVLRGTVARRSYLVVDATDRLVSVDDFRRLSALVNALGSLEVAGPWRVLLVCQSEAWNRVQRQLEHVGLGGALRGEVVTDLPSHEQLRPIWEAFPALRTLGLRRDLSGLLWRPKILDLVARSLLRGQRPNLETWVGESSVAAWFWEAEVLDPPGRLSRVAALQEVAQIQGDELLAKVPAMRLSDRAVADELVEARLLETEGTRIGFSHDLYGDWIRLQLLLDREADLADYLPQRASSPLWHRSIRLYGVYLLEQRDVDAWRAAFEAFTSLGEAGRSIQDLLLESLVFMADAAAPLDALWDAMSAKGGQLLKRLLGRFLAVGTRPDPSRLARVPSNDRGRRLAAAARHRRPEWPLWMPLLRFLERHGEECADLAPQEAAQLCECWLRRGGRDWPYRELLTRLALRVADRALAKELGYGQDRERTARAAFLAVLAGYPDLPDAVADLALRASGRIGEPLHRLAVERDGRRFTTVFPYHEEALVEIPEPWPDGPVTWHHETFAKVCLGDDGLLPVVELAPELASEILLALVIEPAHPNHPFNHVDDITDRFGIQLGIEWAPPFWAHFPLPTFFLLHPEHATSFVLRLVNFATERWAAREANAGRNPIHRLAIGDDSRELLGDESVFYWFRDNTSGPDPVVTALMALEWYLYDCLDRKESVEARLEQIIRGMRSVAFAGLLTAVAAKSPDLYLGPLTFLLLDPWFYRWQELHQLNGESHQLIGWAGHVAADIEAAREWHSMPHRRALLYNIGTWLYLLVPTVTPQFEQAKNRWRAAREGARTNGDQETINLLDRLLSFYDRSNYEEVHLEDGRTGYQYRQPTELAERFAPGAQEAEQNLLTLTFPIRCRTILDGDVALSEEELEGFWTIAQELRPPPPGGVAHLEDSLCGAAAVLLLHHRPWLDENPERLDWSRQTLIDTILNPPQPSGPDCAEMAWDRGWAQFCAEAVPGLWAEEPGSPELRRCMAELSLDFHYVTSRILVRAVFAVRHRLGDDSCRFWRVVRAVAVERWRLNHIRSRAELSQQEIPPEGQAYSPEVLAVLDGFIAGSLGPELPPLPLPDRSELAWALSSQEQETRRARPVVDVHALTCAAAGLPALATLCESDDRQEVIRAWEEVLDAIVAEIQNGVPGHYAATVYHGEREALRAVALVVGQMRRDEGPERIYAKVLALGTTGAHHVESFLWDWFMICLHGEVEAATFGAVWRGMAEWVWRSPEWSETTGRQGRKVRDLWRELMGLNYIYVDSWKAEHAEAVGAMRELFARWAEFDLASCESAKAFARLARTPAGAPLRLEGLAWLRSASGRTTDLWKEPDVQDAVVRLLAATLDDEAALRRHAAAFAALQELLGQLCSRQNAQALELRSVLAAGLSLPAG